ncbi:YdeI/OmpD-associated family protein [Thalassococcus sp. BH17M4-6]|uniref:YdeI/OmpD-associated family protein n=1 Tax=Thalassococcus sp. BH17M4-6 TaxID=3413148 RepID=UPI003BC68375
MPEMISEVGDYFAKGCGRCDRFDTPDCSALRWRDGVAALRRICLSSGLDEAAKWGHPVYMHAARNIAMIGAFRGDFRLSFFNAALLSDPEGMLEPPGPNSRTASLIRFGDAGAVAQKEPAIRAYLAEAMGHAEKGILPKKDTTEPDLPEELEDALDADPELAEAFRALTPGRRRSYAITIGAAKTAATRIRRIAGYRDKILAGKGAQDR